jgi:hypothetical protein
MAIIRNLTKRLDAFDLPALGTADHRGGVHALNPVTGQRGLHPHVMTLPLSVTLTACSNPRSSIGSALGDGSAREVPDEVLDDPAIVSRVAAKTLAVVRSQPTTHTEVST